MTDKQITMNELLAFLQIVIKHSRKFTFNTKFQLWATVLDDAVKEYKNKKCLEKGE